MIYPSEQAGLVPENSKKHEWLEGSGLYRNMQIREGYHAVKVNWSS